MSNEESVPTEELSERDKAMMSVQGNDGGEKTGDGENTSKENKGEQDKVLDLVYQDTPTHVGENVGTPQESETMVNQNQPDLSVKRSQPTVSRESTPEIGKGLGSDIKETFSTLADGLEEISGLKTR